LYEYSTHTEKLDWARLKTRLLITEGHRRKASGKENLRKTYSNVIECNDARLLLLLLNTFKKHALSQPGDESQAKRKNYAKL